MTPAEKRNISLNAVVEAFWGMQTNMIMASTVLTVLLQKYGAGARMIGAVSAIETAGVMVPQILGAWLFRSRKHLQRDLVFWHIAAIVPFYLLMALVTLFADRLNAALYRGLLLVFFLGSMVGVGIVVAAWLDWIAHIFETRIRGRALGFSYCCSALAGMGGAALAGLVIGSIRAPVSYALLYFTAAVLATVSILCMKFMDDPAARENDVRSPAPSVREIVARIRSSLVRKPFVLYLAGRLLAMTGFSVMPFAALHFLSPAGGGLSNSTIVMSGVGLALGSAAAHLVYGQIGDAFGHRIGVMLGTVLQIGCLAVLLTVRGTTGCVLAYLLAGMAMSSWISHTNMVIESALPGQARIPHISTTNLILGSFGAVIPLVAGMVAAQWGLPALFKISLGCSFAALAWYVILVRDPRSIPTRVTDATEGR